MRIVGFVLLGLLVVGGLVFLLKKKKEKSNCAKVLELGEKGVDAYYHTKSSSIVDDKKDEQLCKLAAAAAGTTAKATTSFLTSHTTVKTAVLAATNPATTVSEALKGNGQAAANSLVNTLTGADVINSIGGSGTPVGQQSCEQITATCKKTSYGTMYAPGNIWCTEYAKRCKK